MSYSQVEGNNHQLDLLKQIQQNSSYPLHSIWLKTQKYIYESKLGFVAYKSTRRAHIVAGDPLCFQADIQSQKELFSEFVEWSHGRGKIVCGYYFSEEFATSVDNFSAHKVGVSCFLDIDKYSEKGYKSRDIRRALSHGCKSKLEFIEIAHPQKNEWLKKLKPLEKDWFQTKRGPQIYYLLDEISQDFLGAGDERWFVVTKGKDIHAFLSLLPYQYQGATAYYVDHLYQFEQEQKWALDFLLAQLLRILKSEGTKEFALGLAAFQNIEDRSMLSLGFKLNQKLEPFYKTNGLYAYKRKFSSREVPRYLLLDESCWNLRQVLAIISATYSPN